jgi:hypothetical protein
MNDHCLEKLCTIAAAVGVIGLGMEIGAVAVGVLEGLATTGGLLTMIRATRRGDFQRMLASIKREVEGEYRDWIKAKHGQESWYVLVNIESALAELDGIIDKCVPTPEEVVAVDLNGDRLAERMLEKAAKSSRAYAPDTDNPAAREILRTIVARTFESVRSHPDYAAQLRTYIDEEELKRLGEIKQDTGEIKRDTAEIRAALTALAAPVMCVEDSGKASNPEAFSLVVREGLLIRLRGRVLLHPNFLNKASQQCRNRKLISAITDPAQDLTDNESLVGKLLAYLVIPNLHTKSWSEDELQRVVDEAGPPYTRNIVEESIRGWRFYEEWSNVFC